MEKYNILNEDVYVTTNITNLNNIYSSKNENTPLAVLCCMEGELQININGVEYNLASNQIIILGPHTVVESSSGNDELRGAVIYINERIWLDNMNNIIWENVFTLGQHPIISINDKSATLFKCYGKLVYTILQQNERLYREEVITTLLKAIILELMHELQSSPLRKETPGKGLIRQGEILFKKFIALLSKTAVKPRLVTWYAQQLCVTPKYLSTTCKSVSGKSANNWINEFVVRDIHRLLKYSDKSIKEICDYLEFPNLSFFGKYVKAHLGSSPKEYRRRIKNIE